MGKSGKDDPYVFFLHGRCPASYLVTKNDLLSLLLDDAPPDQKNIYDLNLRILMTNFGAIHTASVVGPTLVLLCL